MKLNLKYFTSATVKKCIPFEIYDGLQHMCNMLLLAGTYTSTQTINCSKNNRERIKCKEKLILNVSVHVLFCNGSFFCKNEKTNLLQSDAVLKCRFWCKQVSGKTCHMFTLKLCVFHWNCWERQREGCCKSCGSNI